jgi:hypothetical protein
MPVLQVEIRKQGLWSPWPSTRRTCRSRSPPPRNWPSRCALAAVCGEVQDYCGWHIVPVLDETVTVDGSGSDMQPLPTAHLVGVTAVTSDGYAVATAHLKWSKAGYLRYPARRPGC